MELGKGENVALSNPKGKAGGNRKSGQVGGG